METIYKNKGYKIEFNGSSTYFITDKFEDCIFRTNTERKAKNFLNKVLKSSGLI